jgi:hypothetical protein
MPKTQVVVLIDHLVGTTRQGGRKFETERFRDLQIDHHLETGRPLDGEAGRFRSGLA